MRMTMTAADVVEILGWLGAASADVWLDGGWGVDALVGEQTREHKDLDLIVRDAHEHRMREILATHGFIQVGGVPQFFVLADERGREMEVHPVRFDDQGNGHLLTQDGEPFGHSAEAFAATGSVSGYRVACLSAEAQMSNHSWGYEPGDTDVHDMRLLHDRLGTPFKGPYQPCEPGRVLLGWARLGLFAELRDCERESDAPGGARRDVAGGRLTLPPRAHLPPQRPRGGCPQ